jgi:hypothetical protein
MTRKMLLGTRAGVPLDPLVQVDRVPSGEAPEEAYYTVTVCPGAFYAHSTRYSTRDEAERAAEAVRRLVLATTAKHLEAQTEGVA